MKQCRKEKSQGDGLLVILSMVFLLYRFQNLYSHARLYSVCVKLMATWLTFRWLRWATGNRSCQSSSTCWHLVTLFVSTWLEDVPGWPDWYPAVLATCRAKAIIGSLSRFVAFHQRRRQKNILSHCCVCEAISKLWVCTHTQQGAYWCELGCKFIELKHVGAQVFIRQMVLTTYLH